MSTTAATDKEAVIEAVRSLPDRATLDEIAEEIRILAAIRRGQDAIARGDYVTHDEARRRLGQWLSK